MNLSPEIALCAPPGDCVAGIPSSASSEERAAATLVLEKLVEAFRQGTGNPGKPGRETRGKPGTVSADPNSLNRIARRSEPARPQR